MTDKEKVEMYEEILSELQDKINNAVLIIETIENDNS